MFRFKILLSLASALVFLSSCAKPEDVPTTTATPENEIAVENLANQTFCTQSFNVYAPAYASAIENRLSRLAQEVSTETCELIQFQEFWRDKDFEHFRKNLGTGIYSVVRADALRNDKMIIGLSTLFDGKIFQSQSRIFEVNNEGGFLDGIRDAAGVQKGYTLLNIETRNSPRLLAINLHTHPDKEIIRLAQMTQLVKDIVAQPELLDHPMVLTADLNATPNSPEMAMLKDLLLLRDSYLEANTSYGKICTYCGDNPLGWDNDFRVIDFVLIGNSARHQLKSQSSEINLKGTKTAPLSDHYGVRSMLAWKNQSQLELTLMDPLLYARVDKARQTISRALKVLVTNKGKGFKAAAETLKQWDADFAAGNLTPGFAKLFRTP